MQIQEQIETYIRSTREETLQLVRDLCRIPAPSGHEEKRAEYCRDWFRNNGFENVSIDPACNVLAPVGLEKGKKFRVMAAHTDTVFPDTEPMSMTEKDGILRCPGVTDDTANLAVMMVCARWYKDHFPAGADGILFAANSCEEGLGNLKGIRKIAETFGPDIREFISLDEADMDSMIVRAVGSRRCRVTVRTEGGHSFNDFGRPNAIHQLAGIITCLYGQKPPQGAEYGKTTFNTGCISGGTSVNTIAQEASMLYEYRSDSRNGLAVMAERFEKTLARFRADGVVIETEWLGDRPCSADVPAAPFEKLKEKVRAAMRETFHVEAREESGSTDCNIPLSMGIPAVCFGVCRGGGAHTREEYLETDSLSGGCRLLLNFLLRG